MKKMILIFIIALMGITLFANVNSISLSSSSTNLELLRSDDNNLQMKLTMDEILAFDVITNEGTFSQISIESFTHSTSIGAPKLPIIRKLISVPFGTEVSAQILNYETSKIKLEDFGINYQLIPTQLPVSKSADPSEIVFSYDPKIYSKNQFISNEIISTEELGIMRGVRLFILEISPIQYNPVEGTILVNNNIDIKVDFIGGDHAQTQWKRAKAYSPYFEATFAKSVINYSHIQSRDQITQYPIKYIILSDPMFEEQLQPFIEWKTEKGFEVIEAYTDDPNVGNTMTSIKNFLQDQYDAGTPENPAPSFVLFVGDVTQIPAWAGSTGGHITDLNYVKLDGTDFIADMYYGRFSANNAVELQPQIDKTLEYEKYEMPDPSYLEEVVMIAGMDSSHGSTWGNGQISYGTSNYFNADHGILSHTYLYPNSGSNSANIIQNVSDGIGYINYTAHGSSTSWANPSFIISNINSLQNEHKYGLVVGNCCLTNKFEIQTCFGEAWLRAENKGSIGYIGGTNSTYWDEDYWWGVGATGTVIPNPTYETTGLGTYDGLFHDHGETFADWYTTTGGMIFKGNMAVTEGGSSIINYYWEIYSLMGDPSLTPYLGVPQENLATYPDVIFLGLETIQITAEPYSYVSLTMDGVIHGNGLIDDSGTINLEIDAFTNPGMAKIVITKQNRVPLIDEIEVIPSSGPYVLINSYEMHDNNNDIPEYNETITLDVNLENVGTESANNVNATLSTADTYITITDAVETVALIDADEIVSLVNAFVFDTANNIPDQHTAMFSLEMAADEDTWTSQFNITFNAPAFEAGFMIIADSGGDGILDPGETATLSLPLTNSGNAASEDIVAELTSSSPDLITVTSGTYNSAGLDPAEQTIATFDIEVDDNATTGMIATLDLMVNSGGYTNAFPYYPFIGLVMENFETGDFSLFSWEFGGDADWTISNGAYEGSYCAKSGAIGNNASTNILLELDVMTDGEISFYRTVSSEANYDYLRFFIDNSQMEEWSGDVGWAEETYSISAGNHTVEWRYVKDTYETGGTDCARIDYITFPAAGGGNTPIISLSTYNIEFGNVSLNETAVEQLTILNLGTEELNGTIDAPECFSSELTNYSIEASGSLEIDIEFTPTEAITYSGDLIITSNDPNQEEVTVALIGIGVSVGNGLDLLPTVTELNGNYPNPFNPTTNIKFSLKADAKVSLNIYNVRGQKVKTLINDNMQAGYHSIIWDGRDESGKSVTSGVYFSSFDAENDGSDYTSIKKMILLK